METIKKGTKKETAVSNQGKWPQKMGPILD